jgi:hypothetical protein
MYDHMLSFFEPITASVVQEFLEELEYGDELWFAEMSFISNRVVIDLCSDSDDDEDDTPVPYWTAIDELEMIN